MDCPKYSAQTGPVVSASKPKETRYHRKWKTTLPPEDILVYSDGSKSPEGRVGYGYVVIQKDRELARGCGQLADPAEVFDGEAEGARYGLREALRHYPKGHVYICLDNAAAASGFRNEAPVSSNKAFREVHAAMAAGNISIRWTPGHTGIPGNESADKMAKDGTELPGPTTGKGTAAGVKNQAKASGLAYFKQWWSDSLPPRYKELGIGLIPTYKSPPALLLPRNTLAKWTALRTGHGDFDWYHKWRKHSSWNRCSCGHTKTPEHMVFCTKTRKRQQKWPVLDPAPAYNRRGYWKALIQNPEAFNKFVTSTNFYTDICPHYTDKLTNPFQGTARV